MKIKFTFFVLLALISATTFSQRLSLEVYSNVTEENKFLSSMDYNKNFNSIEELTKEVEKIVENSFEREGEASKKTSKNVCLFFFLLFVVILLFLCLFCFCFFLNDF